MALSGGGARAALFSLGALLYVVRAGVNRRVRVVSSVSGGSITNAAVGLAGDFSSMDAEDFEKVAGKTAASLANQGTFFLPPLVWLIAGPLVFAVGMTVLTVVVRSDVSLDVRDLAILVSVLFVSLLVGLLVMLFIVRAPLQRLVFRQLMLRLGGRSRFAPTSPRLDDLAQSTVLHVLCSTDLKSGEPVYFSRGWIASPWWGWSDECRMRIHEAVYASAAFPGAFPPYTFALAAQAFTGGGTVAKRPRKLRLVDGGVYNNLGTDVFGLLADQARQPWGPHDLLAGVERPADLVVVNASAPPARKPRVILSWLRTMIVLYENTVRPRLRLLGTPTPQRAAAVVLDVSSTPIEIATQQARADGGAEATARAAPLVAALGGTAAGFWDRLRDETSTLATTLRPIGTERAIRLLQHGYYSALAGLHVRHGTDASHRPSEDYFRRLLDERPAGEGHSGAAPAGTEAPA